MYTSMNLVLTRKAEDKRLLRGIKLFELEETIARGIKTRQKNAVIARYGDISILYTKTHNAYTIISIVH